MGHTVDNSATSRTAITAITAIGHVSMKSFVVERTEWRFLFLTHPLGAAKSVMNVLRWGVWLFDQYARCIHLHYIKTCR